MPHLIGQRIVLREYRMEDLDFMRMWVNDPEITDTLSDIFTYPQTLHDTESFLRLTVEGKTGSKGFVIAEKESLAYIGQIDLHKVDWKNRSAVLGIVIGRKECLSLGYGKEAIDLLMDFAFNGLNLHRIELEVLEYNERAKRCYAKCGFREEGVSRDKVYKRGRYWDIVRMSLLESEYRTAVPRR